MAPRGIRNIPVDELPPLALDENSLDNGAEEVILMGVPYVAQVTLEGTSALLFHAYNAASVQAKGAAPKGSAAKKTDDIETQ